MPESNEPVSKKAGTRSTTIKVKWSSLDSENLRPGITGSRLKKPVNGHYNATDIQKQGLNEGKRDIIEAKSMGPVKRINGHVHDNS